MGHREDPGWRTGRRGGRAWAIVAMGGAANDENSFWELFTRPVGSTQWSLVTPPGVADNGGLVAAVPVQLGSSS